MYLVAINPFADTHTPTPTLGDVDQGTRSSTIARRDYFPDSHLLLELACYIYRSTNSMTA